MDLIFTVEENLSCLLERIFEKNNKNINRSIIERRFIKIILWHIPQQLQSVTPRKFSKNKTCGKTTTQILSVLSNAPIWPLLYSFGGN